MLAALLCAARPAISQDAAAEQADVVAPAVPTESAEPAEPAEPTAAAPSIEEPVALGETESTARTDRRERDRASRGIRKEMSHDGEFIGVLNNGMILTAVPTFYQMLAKGTLLILAVLLAEYRLNRS